MSEYTPTKEEIRNAYESSRMRAVHYFGIDEFSDWFASVKAEAWDEGRNAKPVQCDEHETYCSEYECFCDVYVNPYRQGETE